MLVSTELLHVLLNAFTSDCRDLYFVVLIRYIHNNNGLTDPALLLS